jgi:hypothetical protein
LTMRSMVFLLTGTTSRTSLIDIRESDIYYPQFDLVDCMGLVNVKSGLATKKRPKKDLISSIALTTINSKNSLWRMMSLMLVCLRLRESNLDISHDSKT